MLTSVGQTGKCQFGLALASFSLTGGVPGCSSRVVLHWTPIERGVTGVPTTDSSPTIRRRELGGLLRTLRTERGWTVDQVAGRLQVSSSKVSRLETGQRGVTETDIHTLCDLYGVDAEHRQRLTELARAGRRK